MIIIFHVRFTSFNEMLSLAFVSLGFFAGSVWLSISFGRSCYRTRAARLMALVNCIVSFASSQNSTRVLARSFRFYCSARPPCWFITVLLFGHGFFSLPRRHWFRTIKIWIHRTQDSEKPIKRELGIYLVLQILLCEWVVGYSRCDGLMAAATATIECPELFIYYWYQFSGVCSK